MLSERKHTILQSLIQEYVISAHPVASSTLARYYVPLLSAATVRNELSWLENRGYVVAPHTSAGRMPTTTGYRIFVNNLLLHPKLTHAIFKQRRWDGVDSGDEPFLATAESPVVSTGFSAKNNKNTASSLSTLPHYQQVSMSSLATIAAAADKLAMVPEVLGFLAERSKGLMVFWAPQLSNAIIHRGLPLLLSQPEFTETSSALPIMQLLESHGELMAIFRDIVSTDCLHIRIGSENKDAQLYQFSLVAMRFDCGYLMVTPTSSKVSGTRTVRNYGVVALFGPTRMDYEGAIGSISSLVKNLESPPQHQRS